MRLEDTGDEEREDARAAGGVGGDVADVSEEEDEGDFEGGVVAEVAAQEAEEEGGGGADGGGDRERAEAQLTAEQESHAKEVAKLREGAARLQADLARYNIQVNCISPGYFQTDMNTALWQDPDFDAWLKKRTPAARWGQLDELVGHACLCGKFPCPVFFFGGLPLLEP